SAVSDRTLWAVRSPDRTTARRRSLPSVTVSSLCPSLAKLLPRPDLNRQPLGYEPNELPDCSTGPVHLRHFGACRLGRDACDRAVLQRGDDGVKGDGEHALSTAQHIDHLAVRVAGKDGRAIADQRDPAQVGSQ